jgi:sorting nexin-4
LIDNEAYASILAQNFLIRVASHPILSRDEHFMGFLQQKDGWRESVKETGTLPLWDAKSVW